MEVIEFGSKGVVEAFPPPPGAVGKSGERMMSGPCAAGWRVQVSGGYFTWGKQGGGILDNVVFFSKHDRGEVSLGEVGAEKGLQITVIRFKRVLRYFLG